MSQGKKLPSDFWHKTFLEAFKNNLGIVTHACKRVDITPQCYYEYRLRNPSFGKKVDLIKEQLCLPILEDIAQARAMKDNDRLLMFMLRNLGGLKWNRDKLEEAIAKNEPYLQQQERYKEKLEDQHPPTKAERAAAKAYLAVIDSDGEEDE